MFRKCTILGVSFVSALLILVLAQVCIVRKSDINAYTRSLQEYETISSQPLMEAAQQRRVGVRKDIWFSQEDKTRLHYRIDSESSLLTMVPKENKFEVVENLYKIKCWMQEKLYYQNASDPKSAVQQMRFLEAEEGVYRYNLQQFLASSVSLSMFHMPGHELIPTTDTKQAFLRGKAEDVSFAVSGKSPQFQAHQFKASLKKESSP